MFASRDFVACIHGQLKERGFGAKRIAQHVESFDGLTQRFRDEGYGDQISQSMAMNAMFEEMAFQTRERAKRVQKTIEVQVENNDRIKQGLKVYAHHWTGDGGTGYGAGLARAAISLLQGDPRFQGVNVEGTRASLRGKYFAMIADGLEKYGKGAFGTQRGGATLNDVVFELGGISTGNADAKAFALSIKDMDNVVVDDRNRVGGSLRKLDTFLLPQKQNAAVLTKMGFDAWHAKMQNWVDWDRTTWPDGTRIPIADRARVMAKVYDTFSTGGANRIDPAAFSGRGSAIGNTLDDHRFIHYKGPKEWLEMNEAFGGGGNPFDVLTQHVERMAHRTALIDQFGPNPELAFENIKGMVLKHAADLAKTGAGKWDKRAVEQVNAMIKNKLEPMMTTYIHANPMDPNSPMASGVMATSNMMAAAQMGSAAVIAVPSDFLTTLTTRFMNHLPLVDGIGKYLAGITTNFKDAQRLAARFGHVFDTHVGATYSTERFSSVATYGPAWSRTVSDDMIRLSGLTRHTEISRFTAQSELMGTLWDYVGKQHSELPFASMMRRYGIGEAEWDAVRRAITPFTPAPGAEFFRPLDILKTNLANKDELYKQFFTMVHQESLHMVPGSTLEAAVTLKGTSRPDTYPGILAHSFAMYKNFPITFWQMYSRLMMSEERMSTRLGFITALGLGTVAVGALATQMREISKGRNPMPMDTAAFWGKAILAGGGLSIFGDFLFGGINEYGQGIDRSVGGPLAGLAASTANLVLGDPFKYVSIWDHPEKEFKSTFLERSTDFLKRNSPGSNLWYARLALERSVWDTMDEWANPNMHKKWRARERKQEKNFGNTYYSPPGAGIGSIGNIMGEQR